MNDMPCAPTFHPRKPWLAVLLSVAATGLGHIYCGRLVKGLILFFVSFAFAPVIVAAAQNAASTPMLVLVIGSLLLMLAVFIYALLDAGLLARRVGREYELREYNHWALYLLLIIVGVGYPANLSLSIREHVLQAFKIPSPSMAPDVLPGDHIFLNKAIYKIQAPRRGDVVVFTYPDDRRLFYIKRIVALPGDSVEIRANRLYINDRPLTYTPVNRLLPLNFDVQAGMQMEEEMNGAARYPVLLNSAAPQDMTRVVVPHGQCFVLSDNRALMRGGSRHFGDSRSFGPIPLADVKGRVDYIYWPALSWARFGRFNHF